MRGMYLTIGADDAMALRAPSGAEAGSGGVPAIPVGPVVLTDQNFFFKKDKLGNKRPTVTLSVPLLTEAGLLDAMQDEKVRNLLLSLANDTIIGQVREQVNDDAKPVNLQSELVTTKLNIVAIANMPQSERRGGGIAKEVWEEFSKDYLEVMPALTGKNAEQLGNAVELLVKRLIPVKTNKKVLTFLKTQIALWFTNSARKEEFMEVYEYLNTKADTLLSTDEEALLQNL